jgi:HAMP domain-containing protein
MTTNRGGAYVLVAAVQAVYFIITGVWSLIGIRSFQAVTGRKVDVWLVKTVGVLVIAIGGALGMAAARRSEEPEIPLLGVSSAVALTAVDVVYVAQRRIRPVYLLDAVAEIGLIGWWTFAWLRRR